MSIINANTDPNAMLVCPYDSNHRIKASAWITHLVKCAKSNPEKAKDFQKCPMNGSHIVHKSKYQEHVLACMNKDQTTTKTPFQESKSKVGGNCRVPIYSASIKKEAKERTENWDADAKNNEALSDSETDPKSNLRKSACMTRDSDSESDERSSEVDSLPNKLSFGRGIASVKKEPYVPPVHKKIKMEPTNFSEPIGQFDDAE